MTGQDWARKGGLSLCAVVLSACGMAGSTPNPQGGAAVPATRASASDMRAGMLAVHNRVRADVGLGGLSWSQELADYATQWSQTLARTGCQLDHRHERGADVRKVGENLYWGSATMWSDGRRELQSVTAAEVAQAWADERVDYDYAGNRCAPGRQCGHYTQMVWDSTERVGCGMAICPDLGQIWTCNYDPPGNYIGQRPY